MNPVKRPFSRINETLGSLVKGKLWAQVLVALFLGVTSGVLIGPSVGLVDPEVSKTISDWMALPGQIFLALIQMVVVPLIFASIITGISSSDSMEKLKTIGLSALIFFVSTTTFSILLGIFLALQIQPGKYIDTSLLQPQPKAEATNDNLADENSVDKNLAGESLPDGLLEDVAPATWDIDTIPDRIVSLIPTNPLHSVLNLEMLQVVILAIIFGIAIVAMTREQVTPITQFLRSLQEVCMTIVKGAMRLAPLAVFGLTLQLAAQVGLSTLAGMAVYVGTVLFGLFSLLGLYLLIVFLFIKDMRLRDFMSKTRELQLLAFSTSSSAAVMPLAMKTSEEKFDVHPTVSQFVIPLGATINMNGTALYQGIATLFLAQAFGVNLDTGALGLLVVTAVAASIGSPATPGVGIVILSMILTSVGVPLAGVGLLLGVDRILDMSRTAVNVTGDILATILIDRKIKRSTQKKAPE